MKDRNQHSLGRVFFFSLLTGLFIFGTSCNGEQADPGSEKNGNKVTRGVPTIIRQIPHGTDAFTQGFLFVDSLLYESTGKQFESSLRAIDPKNGDVLKKVPLHRPLYFAEGLTLRNGRLVQLTWLWEIAYVYDYPYREPPEQSMFLLDSLSYGGQGWGLTSDAAGYIMSNGSDTLYFRDDAFNVTGKVAVTLNGASLPLLNELEYVDGNVWANVYGASSIYQIDAGTGKVNKVIDCAELYAISWPFNSAEDVLNGIAYDPKTGYYYLTGKHWRWIFEVTIP